MLHTAMAGSAGNGIGWLVIAELCEEFVVEVVGHFDHEASFFFDRVCVRGEVVAVGRGVASVAEGTFDAEIAFVLMHELDDVVSSDVFGENLDVDWFWARAARRPGGLCGWSWSG